jgi:hypothetical protein
MTAEELVKLAICERRWEPALLRVTGEVIMPARVICRRTTRTLTARPSGLGQPRFFPRPRPARATAAQVERRAIRRAEWHGALFPGKVLSARRPQGFQGLGDQCKCLRAHVTSRPRPAGAWLRGAGSAGAPPTRFDATIALVGRLNYDDVVMTSAAFARLALAELDAPEPNRAPAQLTAAVSNGGPLAELAWDDLSLQRQVTMDPANAAAHRPWVIAYCQQLDALGYRAPGTRCGCAYGLGFVALAPLATGVRAVWTRRRLPPKERKGGWRDFDRVPGARHGWDLLSCSKALIGDARGPRTAALPHPGFEHVWDRQTFRCPRCDRSVTVLNVTLVRGVLEALAEGTGEVVLGQPRGTHTVAPGYAERLPDRGTVRAWHSRRQRPLHDGI